MRVPINLSGAGSVCLQGKRTPWPLLALALVVLVAGCSSTNALSNKDRLPSNPESNRGRVLLMPVDIELSERTFSGLFEPNAAWTATAKAHVDGALDAMLKKHGATPIRYRPSSPNVAFNEQDLQLVKLHEAVGNAILKHKYQSDFALPTKRGKFDWSLGPQVALLQRVYQAEYAVFIHLRDSFASDARIIFSPLTVLTEVIHGTNPNSPVPIQTGFVSLVDLKTGEVIWFNRLRRGTGDLRAADGAKEALGLLFEGFPL